MCGAWSTLEQQIDVRGGSKTEQALASGNVLKPVTLDAKASKPTGRLSVGIADIDEVLG